MKVAIIPARGGSKRIPRKNIRIFAGKPMIAHSIEAALASGLFGRVIVSTDDSEIAEVSRQYGAEVPFMRPQSLADDFTGTGAVIKHAIHALQDAGVEIDFVCCIYATAPFLQPQYLQEGYEMLQRSDCSYAFSVTTFPFPIQRAVRVNGDGRTEAIWAENISKRSQDLEEAFHDAGQFYWGFPQAFLNDEPIFSPASIPVILPRHLVQDVDTMEDWQRAELMYRALSLHNEEVGA